MLKRTERLTRNAFGRVAAGRAMHTSLFSVKLLPLDVTKDETKQFSVVVSKKVAKTAVARNALRRKVYAVIRECSPATVHGILYMKPESLHASYEHLRTTIQNLLKDTSRIA